MGKWTKLFSCGLFLVIGGLASLRAQKAAPRAHSQPQEALPSAQTTDATAEGSSPNTLTIRYDEVKSFDVKRFSIGCVVAVKGNMPRSIFRTVDWTPPHLALLWSKPACSDAETFAKALSTLAKQGPPRPETVQQSVLSPSAPPQPLAGIDKVKYDSLIDLARDAQQSADLDEQKNLMRQFMEKSSPFVQKHPDETLLWELRAAVAISLGDSLAGYEAGQKLLAAGAAEIDRMGWLDNERHAAQSESEQQLVEALRSAKGGKIGEFNSEGFVLTFQQSVAPSEPRQY
jgi:hypothetical protein